MKNLIIVASPPACGKTFFSKILAKELRNPVYLDKDTISPLSKKAFEIGNEPYNRDGQFFKTHIRDAEYEAIMGIALESLNFNNNVIVNAPFSKELRSEEYLTNLKNRLRKLGGRLIPVWITCDIDLCHKRMFERNSDRDIWKLKNWNEYIQSENFSTPIIKDLILVDSTTSDLLNSGICKVLRAINS